MGIGGKRSPNECLRVLHDGIINPVDSQVAIQCHDERHDEKSVGEVFKEGLGLFVKLEHPA